MIKTSPVTKTALILCIIFFLIIPVKTVQIICLTFIFTILFSYLYSKNLLKNIDVVHTIKSLKLACNENSDVILFIKNYSVLPAFFCYYFDEAPFLRIYKDKNSDTCMLRPKENLRLTYNVTALERGLFSAGPFKLTLSDPLGLFQIKKIIEDRTIITVRPARINFQTFLQPGIPGGFEKIMNPIFEDITLHKSIRPYKTGDSIRRINWRASAKCNELYINQYDFTYDVPVFVFLNLAEDDYPLKEMRWYSEKAIEIAASIILTAGLHKMRCGFAAYSQDFPFLKPKLNQTDFILDLLSVIKSTPGKLPYNPILQFEKKLPSGTLIYEIGPEVVESYFTKLTAGNENFNTKNLRILKNGKELF